MSDPVKGDQIVKPEIPFNERSIAAFAKEGEEYPDQNGIIKRHAWFKSKFKPDKGPLQILITQMVRQAKIVFDD
jgi:hypothetical protein